VKTILSPLLTCLLSACVVVTIQDCAGNLTPDTSTPSAASLQAIGPVLDFHNFHTIAVRNLRDEPLGRIHDLGIDLKNGRIIEVLVESKEGLFTSGKTVAVPPLALLPDPVDLIYRLNISQEAFAAAPAINLASWNNADRNNRVAAAYRYFGRNPILWSRARSWQGAAFAPNRCWATSSVPVRL